MLLGKKNDFPKFVRAGDEARDSHNWELAVEEYKKAIQHDGSLPWLWVQYGHSLKESGRRSDAEQAYRKSIELEPENSDTYLQLGHVLKLQDRTADAASAYLNSAAMDASSTDARSELIAMGWSTTDIQQGLHYLRGGDGIGGEQNESEQVEGAGNLTEIEVAPASYLADNPDVQMMVKMGLFSSASQHYHLYGRSEGREIVRSLAITPAKNAFVLCPSFGKRCGIGEHARYVFKSLEQAGFRTYAVRSTRELKAMSADLKQDGVLIVNHGPGLFDGYNPELSEGEATSDLLSGLWGEFKNHNLRPVIYMHSLLDRDNEVMYGRQQFVLDFPIPVLTTISSAAAHFRLPHVEHGVQPLNKEYVFKPSQTLQRDNPTIGFFGFFQWGGKDFDALLNVARRLKAKLVGSVATSSKQDEQKLREILTEANLVCDLGTGWVTDDELAYRLAEADYYYLPQKDYDHWNNSGTARFVANFGKPLLLPAHHPFLDLRKVAVFAEEHDLPAIVSYLREDDAYLKASKRVQQYASNYSMKQTVGSIAKKLPEIYRQGALNGFWSANTVSLQALCALNPVEALARLNHAGVQTQKIKGNLSAKALLQVRDNSPRALPLVLQQVEEIEIWRKHYTLDQLYQVNPQDFIVATYRRLVKREPTFFEYRFARDLLPTDWRESNAEAAKRLLQFIGRVWSGDLASPEPENVEVSAGGRRLSPAVFLMPSAALVHSFVSGSLVPCADLVEHVASATTSFSVGNTVNLFALLSLPAAIVSSALSEVCRNADVNVDFDGIRAYTLPRDRYSYVVEKLSTVGVKVSDIFVLDEPVVEVVDARRTTYCVSEFILFEGDSFITNMVRKLSKRNPHTVEFFHIGYIVGARGKLEALKEYISANTIEAQVIDLESVDESNVSYPSLSTPHFRRFINDFRSPVAGGWDARNKYLEDKRDFSRFWIKSKTHRDIWWIQSGENISALEI
jgi:hypothetical protein